LTSGNDSSRKAFRQAASPSIFDAANNFDNEPEMPVIGKLRIFTDFVVLAVLKQQGVDEEPRIKIQRRIENFGCNQERLFKGEGIGKANGVSYFRHL
jgi:hypothetical protein